ncbi:hypothetical protein HPG69_005884 [Diceros bicornis minor]|uniref:Switch-associated protein 70 n=1 Tax=Diceros bicornis minor TaxID=77932 RepID=A0A7J7ETC7_DICBM|nr:hypothetical protein HPG69_005884 [Diceros bicornis minor]
MVIDCVQGVRGGIVSADFEIFEAEYTSSSGEEAVVLSHNLCTVLKVPHDPVALEEHFRDDDEGPVSNQGYMPYLNKFILEKFSVFILAKYIFSKEWTSINIWEDFLEIIFHLDTLKPLAAVISFPKDVQDNFDKIEFNRMCWTLCVKKNLTKSPLLITEEDAFKVWVIFNFLSEDKYPLIIVPEEIEYLLKKLTEAMGGGWQQEQFEHYKINFDDSKDGLSAWELIELVGNGQFSKGMDRQTVSMAINEVFNELILDVLKQGYMMKKGHKRKNWTERWFVLKPNIISYYVGEDLKDKKGDILLDENCCVESLPDKDGKKCLFLIKCFDKTFEISASDKKKKQEWIQAIHSTIHLLKLGSPPPHKEARLRRKELRKKLLAEQEELERQMKELQAANENKQQELETVRKKLEEAASRAAEEEKKRLQTQVELQARFNTELEREKLIRQQMEEQVAQKSSELEQYLQRVRELEDMYLKLQEALEDERQARQDEETQQAIQTTEAEKQELENQRVMKERALQEAMEQLQQLELERKQALEQYEGVKKKLEMATNKTKSWKDKVAQHEGLIRLIEPGSKKPHLITNWGPAAFTEAELEEREKTWKGKKTTDLSDSCQKARRANSAVGTVVCSVRRGREALRITGRQNLRGRTRQLFPWAAWFLLGELYMKKVLKIKMNSSLMWETVADVSAHKQELTEMISPSLLLLPPNPLTSAFPNFLFMLFGFSFRFTRAERPFALRASREQRAGALAHPEWGVVLQRLCKCLLNTDPAGIALDVFESLSVTQVAGA